MVIIGCSCGTAAFSTGHTSSLAMVHTRPSCDPDVEGIDIYRRLSCHSWTSLAIPRHWSDFCCQTLGASTQHCSLTAALGRSSGEALIVISLSFYSLSPIVVHKFWAWVASFKVFPFDAKVVKPTHTNTNILSLKILFSFLLRRSVFLSSQFRDLWPSRKH